MLKKKESSLNGWKDWQDEERQPMWFTRLLKTLKSPEHIEGL
jgi:hypothetical protein